MQSLVAGKKVAVRAASLVPRGAAATALLVKGQVTASAGELLHQRRRFYAKDKSKSVYEYGEHRSDAEELISKVPIVMVDGAIALCDGATIAQTFCTPRWGDEQQRRFSHTLSGFQKARLPTNGGGALGHPLDYIQLHNAKNEPRECRYCGIRYQMKPHH